MTMPCPVCGGIIQQEAEQPVRFCPFCGHTLDAAEKAAPSEWMLRLESAKKPAQKYAIIQEALRANPDDFEANQALLFHGRLHEPMASKKGLDYSIIKCHLLSVFHTPQAYTDAALDAKYDELLRGEQLRRTMALSPDPDGFFIAYLQRLAYEYVDLFIRGDSQNSRIAFGFGRTPHSLAKKCAAPVRKMLETIDDTERLTARERTLLLHAVRQGYARTFAGYTELLDESP